MDEVGALARSCIKERALFIGSFVNLFLRLKEFSLNGQTRGFGIVECWELPTF